jgi:7-cyano-7-deazaguanine reductase
MVDHTSEDSEVGFLGKALEYKDTYAPELLFPIPRGESRQQLMLDSSQLPFHGEDLWTAYELSWLDENGKPQVAMAEFAVPASSPNIIESKSFKYYLNSLNQSRFESWKALSEVLVSDLSKAAGAEVGVELLSLNLEAVLTTHIPGVCVDQLDAENFVYQPDSSLLKVDTGHQVVGEALYSHLLKTNCPVTGQPDWASVWVQYSGSRIDPTSFLAYVVSFRQHQDFHENCVEKMFCDLQACCKAEELTVYARYTRRGGLDINPFRTNTQLSAPRWRLLRQ